MITTQADGAISVYATDLDADGDPDVLSASYRDDKIAWYENQGDSVPSAVYIAGQVIDSQTGDAIPGATVQAQQSTGSSQSSADGSYRLFVSPGTGYTVEATAEGYFSSTQTYVDLEPAAPTLGVDFQLEPTTGASPIVTPLSPDPNPQRLLSARQAQHTDTTRSSIRKRGGRSPGSRSRLTAKA